MNKKQLLDSLESLESMELYQIQSLLEKVELLDVFDVFNEQEITEIISKVSEKLDLNSDKKISSIGDIIELLEYKRAKCMKLSEVFDKAYCEKEGVTKIDLDVDSYKNYKDTSKEKIMSIFKNLNMDIEYFKIAPNKYQIPFNICDLMIQYLLEDSKKGSFVSKLKNNNLNKITTREKKEFLDKFFERLIKSCGKDEKHLSYVEDLRDEYDTKIKILEIADYKREKLFQDCKESIEKNIRNIYNIDDTYGIMLLGPSKQEFNYDLLNTKDTDLLVDTYSLLLKSLNNKWTKIVENYILEKQDNMSLLLQEDIDKMVNFEICMLKDALDVTYKNENEIKNNISKNEIESIKMFLENHKDIEENSVINIFEQILNYTENDH